MDIIIEGHNIDTGEALRTYVSEHLEEAITRYFDHAEHVHVTFGIDAHLHTAHVTVGVGNGILINARSEHAEKADENGAYLAFDKALARVKQQLKKYKDRLRSHHQRLNNAQESLMRHAADQFILQGENNDNADNEPAVDAAPAIIAEMTTEIEDLSVSEAVMRMDLADVNALMFRNSKTEALNMVYRRKDGNIGWVDPKIQLNANEKAA